MGCKVDDPNEYQAKIQELENLMDRYQKLSNWIDKVVDFDFHNPHSEILELNIE